MKTKESLYLLLALIILAVPFLAFGIQVVPRSTPTPRVATVLLAACNHWKADGRACAGAVDGYGAVVRGSDGRILFAPWAKWTRFLGWTTDGHFAIFEQTDQYGNSRGLIFDVEKWELRTPGGDCANPGRMSATCRYGFELVDLAEGKIVQGTGIYYDLPADTQHSLFPEPEKALVWLAALSPDKTRVAILGAAEMKNGQPQDTAVSLYIADLDGSDLQMIPQLTFSPGDLVTSTLTWAEDGQVVSFDLNDGQVYRYHVEDGRIE